jgi:hypothetical protein
MMGSGFRARARRTAILCASALLALPGGARATAASSLYYERTLMHEAGDRCHLFSPAIASALQASSLQARGAAERAGASGVDLAATQDRARTRAWSVPCASADLSTAAARVRDAFDGYAKLAQMSFPGEVSIWQAARKPRPMMVDNKPVAGPRWRLSEPAAASSAQVLFGMAEGCDGPVVVTTQPGAIGATFARLVVRDPAKAPEPYIDPRIGGLAGRTAPASATRSFFAQTRSAAPATLSPTGKPGAAEFSFPPAAAEAMERLDAREAVRIEFVYSGRTGERVSSVLAEVGDFAAGRAFLAIR